MWFRAQILSTHPKHRRQASPCETSRWPGQKRGKQGRRQERQRLRQCFINIEAKSGWPLPKPSTNYPVLSTVLEGYNYIPWPPYKPPSTEQWTHCEVLISGIKSLNITFIKSYEYC